MEDMGMSLATNMARKGFFLCAKGTTGSKKEGII